MSLNFIHIIGARPHFIKAFLIINELKKNGAKNIILHSGQHYDFNMSETFFKEFSLPKPYKNLNIGSLSHGAQTGRLLELIEKELKNHTQYQVIVYGDTNTTLAGALAAVKLNMPLVHIEAGLRTPSKESPEEVNRRICDHISTINFAPTISAYQNLIKEGINKQNIKFCGDVMFDSTMYSLKNVQKKIELPKKYALVTIHRAENTDNKTYLRNIVFGLIELRNEIELVFSMHPRTQKYLKKEKLYNILSKSVKIIEPQKHASLLNIIKKSEFVISDSGGIPKEAAFLKKKSIIIRDYAIWNELIDQKWSILVQPNKAKKLLLYSKRLINLKNDRIIKGFGRGNAARKIAKHLSN